MVVRAVLPRWGLTIETGRIAVDHGSVEVNHLLTLGHYWPVSKPLAGTVTSITEATRNGDRSGDSQRLVQKLTDVLRTYNFIRRGEKVGLRYPAVVPSS